MPGYTGTHHLPYPLEGDPIYQGAQVAQALALALDTALTAGAASTAPTMSAIRTAAQSIPNNVDTAVVFQSAQWDTKPGGVAQYRTDGFQVATRGLYLVTASWTWAANAVGLRGLHVMKNGTSVLYNTEMSDSITAKAGDTVQTVSQQIPLAALDQLHMAVSQTSGGALNGGMAGNGNNRARLTATFLRPITW